MAAQSDIAAALTLAHIHENRETIGTQP
jgi:hypothetical protein